MEEAFNVLVGPDTESGLAPPPGLRYVKTCGAECGLDERTAKMRACTACLAAVYCSTACQKVDWKRHKPECKARRDATATLAAHGVAYTQKVPGRKQLKAAAKAAASADAADPAAAAPADEPGARDEQGARGAPAARDEPTQR